MDPGSLIWVITVYFIERAAPLDEEERWQLVNEMADRPQSGVPFLLHIGLRYMAGSVYLDRGDRPRAEGLWEQMSRLAGRTDDAMLLVRSLQVRPWLDYIDGRLEAAISGTEELVRRADEVGAPVRGRQFSAVLSKRPLLHLGRVEGALDVQREAQRMAEVQRSGPLFELFVVWVRAHVGPSDEAQEGLRRLLTERPELKDKNMPTLALVQLLEIAVQIEDRELCSLLAQNVAPVAFLSTAFLAQTCPARHLGAAHALLGEPDKARAYYHQALEAASKIRFRPEIALTHLQLAELLADSYRDERSEALEHLDLAVSELRDMKMQPALERAIELQEKLGSATGDTVSYPDGLSEREVEVLRLMALGRTNRQIAEELFISASTVSHHVTSILNKTATSNRAEAAIYASRNSLV